MKWTTIEVVHTEEAMVLKSPNTKAGDVMLMILGNEDDRTEIWTERQRKAKMSTQRTF